MFALSVSTFPKRPTHTQPHPQLQLEKELASFDQQGRPLPDAAYLSLLKACNKSRSLPLVQRIYAHLDRYKPNATVFLRENLLLTLNKCGALDNALNVFQNLPRRTAFAWSALISGLTDWGQPRSALAMYQDMLDDGVKPDSYIFVSLFKACGIIPDLEAGRKLHKDARQKGFTNQLLVGNTLVSMYGKCGAVSEAECVFSELPTRDVVSCNLMMAVYVQEEQAKKALCLYRQMCDEAKNLPDEHTMVLALQAVRLFAKEEASFLTERRATGITFEIGTALHAQVRRKGFPSCHFVGNTLISLYGSCGTMGHAVNTFHGLTNPDIVSKTAILSAFVEQGQSVKALQFYSRLSQKEISFNHQTFVIALQACADLAKKEEACWLKDGEIVKAKSLEIGRALHEDARARDLEKTLFVANTLVCMYGKCGALSEAESIFTSFAHTDIVSWNVMLSAYVEQCKGQHALRLFRQMHEEGIGPNRQTFLSVLQACDDMALQMSDGLKGGVEEVSTVAGCIPATLPFGVGIALHADVRRRGLASDVVVGTALMRMYGIFGALLEAESVFCSLYFVDLISCTVMLSVFIEQGEEERALLLYKKMQEEGMLIDEVTLHYILQASLKTGGAEIVRKLHFVVVSGGVDSSFSLVSVTLIHAYGSSGSVGDAKASFDGLPWPDSATWNACIAMNTGEVTRRMGFWMFEQMQFGCYVPDALTFGSILFACTYTGLVEAGIAYFESMSRDFPLLKDVNHLILVIDLLARAGDFVRATHLIKRVPKHTELAAWLCLLSACRIHGNAELAKVAFDRVDSLQTDDHSAYVLMSNICVETRL